MSDVDANRSRWVCACGRKAVIRRGTIPTCEICLKILLRSRAQAKARAERKKARRFGNRYWLAEAPNAVKKL